MRNKFYGCNLNNGKNCGKGVSGTAQQMGFDRYGPNPAGSPSSAPKIDSWVVKLPVFESQAAAHCAGGSPGILMQRTTASRRRRSRQRSIRRILHSQ